MWDIFDDNGAYIARIPLSDKQVALLGAGATVQIAYQPPRSLRGVQGLAGGSFEIRANDAGKFIGDARSVGDYAKQQELIALFRNVP